MYYKKENETEEKPMWRRSRIENVELLPHAGHGQPRLYPVPTQGI
jgi:hypothetical protein